MAEYKNGFNIFGGIPVDSSRRSSAIQTGRAVYVNEDEYSDEPAYKAKADSIMNEGYHREAPFEAPEITVPEAIIPSGTKSITENGTYDVAQFAKADVNVAGGGGGSSDFSTANVTITFSTNDYQDMLYSPVITPAGVDYEGALTTLIIPGSATASQMQYTVPLHNGQCMITTQMYSDTVEVSMSGAVEASSAPGRYLVTGDGTLSIIKPSDDDNPK